MVVPDQLTLTIMCLTKTGTYYFRATSEIHNWGALSDGYSHVANVCCWRRHRVPPDAESCPNHAALPRPGRSPHRARRPVVVARSRAAQQPPQPDERG